MRVYDKIREMSPEELATFLCDTIDRNSCCDHCPFYDKCDCAQNGARAWLESEEGVG